LLIASNAAAVFWALVAPEKQKGRRGLLTAAAHTNP
jgi:hypothetical protein